MTQISDARPNSAGRIFTRSQEAKFRARLEKDFADEMEIIQQLTGEMDSFLDSRRDVPTDDEHDPEGPTLAFERAQAGAILVQVRARMVDTVKALERLKDGSYGICQNCKTQIAAGRLDARPSTPFCISCASLLTR